MVSEEFKIDKGLRQGCCLSPTLFKIYLKKSLGKWEKQCKNMGIQINNDTLFTLYFADNQVVIAEDEMDLSYIVRKLKEQYKEAGLNINMKKSEYLSVGTEDIQDLDMEDEKMKGTKAFTYLGVVFDKTGSSYKEIEKRINKGRYVIRTLNSVLWDKDIRKGTKRMIYKSIIESTVTYGAEVWDITARNKQRLGAMEMDFWRRSAGKSRLDKVRNDEIRRIMEIRSSIVEEIERKQLIWFGHVNRMPEERWPKKILTWIPPEKRKRGRPRTSWRGGIDEAMSARGLEEELCLDRGEWKLGTERRRQL